MNSGLMRVWMSCLLLGLMMFLTGCQPGAIRSDEPAAEYGKGREPSKADVYVQLAIGYLQEGQIETALEKVQRGLELDANNARAHNVIALIYERLGTVTLAEQHYQRALRLESEDPYIRNAYGSFLCAQERFEEADEQFTAALKNPLYQTPEVALTNAGFCAKRNGNAEQAEAYFRRALRSNAKFPPALIQMAQISYAAGNHLSSRAYLQRYLEVAPHTAETLWLGIQTERQLGDQDAVASYELMLRGKFPDSDEMRLLEASQQP